MTFDPHAIENAVHAVQKGEFVIVVDDAERENEGDLILAAEMMTPKKMAFLLKNTSGIICVPMTETRLDSLNLPLMVAHNTESHRTAFTISVDALDQITTGISPEDRTRTVLSLSNPRAKPDDFRRPGHVFPLRAREGGVLKRAGHTESAIDLMKLAHMQPVAVIAEIVNDDQSIARLPELTRFSQQYQIPMITIADLVRYRRQTEKLVTCVSRARLPTPYGEFVAFAYESVLDGVQHLALVKGKVAGKEKVLVRVHSECLTGDIFSSLRCDCGLQLSCALKKIEQEGCGVVIYLRGQEGRGIGLGHKLRAYTLQDHGYDTVEANQKLGLPIDSREYGIGAHILADLGISKISLLSNNPAKYGGLNGYGLEIVERVPLIIEPTSENFHYMHTKQTKLGHTFNLEEEKPHASH